jgi:hypothetical protein
MKKIKKNYTNIILTLMTVLLLGNLFGGKIITPAEANMYNEFRKTYEWLMVVQQNLRADHQRILNRCN